MLLRGASFGWVALRLLLGSPLCVVFVNVLENSCPPHHLSNTHLACRLMVPEGSRDDAYQCQNRAVPSPTGPQRGSHDVDEALAWLVPGSAPPGPLESRNSIHSPHWSPAQFLIMPSSIACTGGDVRLLSARRFARLGDHVASYSPVFGSAVRFTAHRRSISHSPASTTVQ
jgi:hypothetical protein